MKNIIETQISPAVRTTRGKDTIGRLFFLEASGGRIHSANADGSDRKVIVTGAEFLMASSSMLKPDTFTGPTWAFPTGTMVRSSAPISTVRIA